MDRMKLRRELLAWSDVERANGRMTDELDTAVSRVINSLWYAAKNKELPHTMAEDLAALEKAKADTDKSSEHPH